MLWGTLVVTHVGQFALATLCAKEAPGRVVRREREGHPETANMNVGTERQRLARSHRLSTPRLHRGNP